MHTSSVFKSATIIFSACLLGTGCRQNGSRSDGEPSLAELEKEYSAWAARQPRPSAKQVQQVESALKLEVSAPRAAKCGMNMSKSHRYYHFKQVRIKDPIETSVISVAMMQGDKIPPGITVEGPADVSQPDDVQADYLEGEFDLKTGKLAVIWCGPNQAPAPPSAPS